MADIKTVDPQLFADLVLVSIINSSTANYSLVNFDTAHSEPATMLKLKAVLQPFVPDRFVWWNVSDAVGAPRLYLRVPSAVVALICKHFGVPQPLPYNGSPLYFRTAA